MSENVNRWKLAVCETGDGYSDAMELLPLEPTEDINTHVGALHMLCSAYETERTSIPDLIRERVKPLVWVEDGWWRHSAKPFPKSLPSSAFWIMHHNDVWKFISTKEEFHTLEAAQAAANAHHVATILAALDMEGV